MRAIAGPLLLLLMVLTAVVGVLLMWAVSVPLHILGAKAASRRWSYLVGGLWLGNAAGMLEALGTKIVVTGGNALDAAEESAIIICNHHTRIDWMFLWCLARRLGCLQTLKIVLKAPLKKAPFLGWAMQFMQYCFLERDWAVDAPYLTDQITHYSNNQSDTGRFHLLIFPEGTDLSTNNLRRSHDFSAKRGLATYEHVLHPRTKGFEHVIETAAGHVGSVWDCTMGYVYFAEGERPSEKSLFSGRLPREVHLRLRKYPLTAVTSHSSPPGVGGGRGDEGVGGAAGWLRARFAEKEALLSQFAKAGRFDDGDDVDVDDAEDNEDAEARRPSYALVFAFFFVMLVGLGLGLWYTWEVRLYLLAVAVVSGIATGLGGIDRWMIERASAAKEE